MNHLDQLNNAQKQAVEQKNGPILILAGAGAGKTRTITHRILNLINEGVLPTSILAVTFTNKAAKEMRERIEGMIKKNKKINFPIPIDNKPFISTFHSLGVYILKENSQKLGISKYFNIFDRNDSKRAVKESIIKANLDPKQFEPGKILSIISRQKGDFLTHKKYAEKVGNEYFTQVISEVWNNYEKILQNEKALDFDDLLLKTALLLKEDKSVRDYYQKKWDYIHIDEYQDTNKVQYEISKLLSENNQNICVVGDTDQCLLPSTKILTETGEKRIDKIKEGEKIISASGHEKICFSQVSKIKTKNYTGNIIKIKTKKGFIIESTPEHIFFSKFSLEKEVYYVYLMYRKNKGFRIGMVQGKRKTGRPDGGVDEQIGFIVRSNQEKADKMWVLKVCENKQEAVFWENFYSSKYGIPSVVFFDSGRKISMNQALIDKLFEEINTEKRAQKLFADLDLYFDYPHHSPQGTTRSNTKKQRTNLKLTMFDDKRKGLLHPWSSSRVAINTTDIKLKNILELNGFKTRKGKNSDWRLEISRLYYSEAEKIAKEIFNLDNNLILNRSIFLTKNKKFNFFPAGSLHPTMNIAFYNKGKIEEDIIISVEKNKYKGLVYDLNIENTHNYIANNLVVHNCIYSWRGADIKNIFNFEKDFTNVKTILLEENYRSTQNILSAANSIIKKNKNRKEKNLFTKNNEGEKITLMSNYTESQEATAVARKSKELIEKGVSPSEIAVLYRANFQSRALEEAFLMENVPYQVLGTRFFERKEIKDIISFIKASLNPESVTDVKRIINIPPRGIGKLTILKLFSGKESELSSVMQLKIQKFREMMGVIKESSLKNKPSDTIKLVMRETGIEKKLKNGTEEDKERLDNIKELVTLATKYDSLPFSEGIEKLLEDAALATDQDEMDQKKQTDSVKLMTVHASKGLEFDYVFITGLEDRLFPSKRDNNQTELQKEEERRLFYVALTRARKKLFLSYTSVRTIFGSRQINTPSEFICDINESLIEEDLLVNAGNFGVDGEEKTIYLEW